MASENPFRLDGRAVAVIGAGSGIGEGAAEACARQGARVACFDVNLIAARATADRIVAAGGEADAAELDILDPDAMESALGALEDLAGVVATPGVNVRKRLLDYQPDEFDRVVTLNLRGALNVLQVAGGLLSAKGGGSIVLLSSIRSQVVEPGQGVYAATKAGIAQLARTAAAELGGAGVRVNALAPGVVDTPLTKPIQQNEAGTGPTREDGAGPVGKAGRDRQRGRVPGVRCVELHDRRRALRRRRLDRDRRPLRSPSLSRTADAAGSRLGAVMAAPNDLFRLDGKTAVVTGASSGLGIVFAQALAAAGASVVVSARRLDRLEQLAADIERAAGRLSPSPATSPARRTSTRWRRGRSTGSAVSTCWWRTPASPIRGRPSRNRSTCGSGSWR